MIFNPPVSEIMTKEVACASPNDFMSAIGEIFKNKGVHHVPIIEDGCVVGIVSTHDYNTVLTSMSVFNTQRSKMENQVILNKITVGDVMTKNVSCVHRDTRLNEVVKLFRENRFHAVPVVDANQKLVGIVTTFDLISFAFGRPIIKVDKSTYN